MPFAATPGPTMPTHVFAISSWKSPWFHANFGSTQVVGVGVPHVVEFDPWKKKSEFPNIVNVGVRFGSLFTMCSACFLDRVGEPLGERNGRAALVRIVRRQPGDVTLELADGRIRPRRAAR